MPKIIGFTGIKNSGKNTAIRAFVEKNPKTDVFSFLDSIEIIKNKIERSNADIILINDIKLDCQAEFIRSLGGKIIKIERYIENVSLIESKNDINHNLVDIIINNNGSIKYLQENSILVINFIFNN